MFHGSMYRIFQATICDIFITSVLNTDSRGLLKLPKQGGSFEQI